MLYYYNFCKILKQSTKTIEKITFIRSGFENCLAFLKFSVIDRKVDSTSLMDIFILRYKTKIED